MRSRLDASRRLSSRAGWRRLARHERSVCARCSAPAASGQVARGRQTRSSYGSTTIYLLRRAASQVHAVGMHADCGRAAAAPGSPLSCRSAWSHSALRGGHLSCHGSFDGSSQVFTGSGGYSACRCEACDRICPTASFASAASHNFSRPIAASPEWVQSTPFVPRCETCIVATSHVLYCS